MHFAQVVDGKVLNVIVAGQDVINSGLFGAGWVQTSYNTRGNVHCGEDGQPDGGVALRGNYAGIGSIYDKEKDAFYTPAPYPSWTLSKDFLWEAPTTQPEGMYTWDEATLTWVEVIYES